jgi:Tripartite tricarboxylate transporter TctB family
MRTTLNLRFLLALGVALVAGYAVYASLSWPYRAALFPRVIGIPLLLIALVEMFLSAFSAEEKTEGHAVDFEITKDIDPAVARKRTLAIFLWVVAFFILILLLGFPIAVPLFVFLYIKVAGGESWTLSISLAFFSWIFIEGLFDRLLHIPLPQGWLLAF